MIVISEPVHFADTHLQVNSAFVALMNDVYDSENILLIAEEKHGEAIVKKVGDDRNRISLKTFKKYSKEGRSYWLQKIWGESLQIIKILLLAQKTKPKLLVWLCLFPTGHLLLSILYKLFFRSQKQIIILHAELEYLESKKLTIFEKFLKKCLNVSFQLANKNTSYLALGKHIKPIQSLKSNQFFAIFHPFIFDEKSPIQSNREPLQICILGTIKQSKNAQLFYELASRFKKEIEEGRVVFNAIGKVFDDIIPFRNEWVNDFAKANFIPYEAYLKMLQQQHVALFFYDETMYRNSASGAMLEAINMGLPIISLKNYCFQALNKEQNIGKEIHNLDEIKTEIDNILSAPNSFILNFKNSKIMFLQQNSFPLQSQRMKEILTQIGI